MKDSGWRDWNEPPYRGDGEPKAPKRKRRFVNVKKERRQIAKTILGIIILSAIFFGYVMTDPTTPYDNSIKIAAVVIVIIVVLIFVAGILSLNKFRKGYDVDISDEKEKDNRKKR